MKKTLATLLVVALVASLCGVMFVSAEENNIALGKEVLNAADRGSYNAKLTDVVALDKLTYEAADWFGFYWNPGMTPEQNEAQKANATDGIAKPTVDLGATMALILLSIVPVIIFYLTCQKHIIKGVAAGAVKG